MNRKGKVGLGVAIAFTAVTVIFGAQDQTALFPVNQTYEIAATRAVSYQAVPTTRKSGWGVARGLSATINHMHRRLELHEPPFAINVKGDWGPKRNLNPTLQRVHDLLKRLPYFGSKTPKYTVIVVRSADGYRERARKHDRNPAMILNTEGTQAIDIIVGTTVARFPLIRSAGIYVCKYIAGTYTLSQHAFANAVDFVASTDVLDRVAAYQNQLRLKGWLPVSQIIWRGRDIVSGHSVYDHYDHIHDSGAPLQSGSSCRHG